jgi:hypothetical protein
VTVRVQDSTARALTQTLTITVENGREFSSVGAAAGLQLLGSHIGAAWADYDNDHDLDLLVADNSGDLRLYRNNGVGGFSDVGAGVGVAGSGAWYGVAWGDYDGDNDVDAYTLNFSGPNSLFRNNGNGTFSEVAGAAGVADSSSSRGAVWVDYNGDGRADLSVARDGANRLYRNNGDGTFSDLAPAAGVDHIGNGRTTSWADYDNDGDVDLYLTNVGADVLYRNNGDGTFTDVTVSAGIWDNLSGFSAAWADYDNDDDFDLYVANSDGSGGQLYQNDGDGTFTNVTVSAKVDGLLSFSASWNDYDHDGDVDLYVGRTMLRNNGDGTFSNVTGATGLGEGGFVAGTPWGDYDGDNDEDLFLPSDSSSSVNRLMASDPPPAGSTFLKVLVRGTGGSRDQGGVTLRLKAGGQIVATRVVDAGSSSLASQGVVPVTFYNLVGSTSYTLEVRSTDGTTASYTLGTPSSTLRTVTRGSGVS